MKPVKWYDNMGHPSPCTKQSGRTYATRGRDDLWRLRRESPRGSPVDQATTTKWTRPGVRLAGFVRWFSPPLSLSLSTFWGFQYGNDTYYRYRYPYRSFSDLSYWNVTCLDIQDYRRYDRAQTNYQAASESCLRGTRRSVRINFS